MSPTASFPASGERRTQAERRARSRQALLESAARGISRNGYANLVLEDVARDAGYTRGALYHQFKDKDDLGRAVIEWVEEAWGREVGDPAKRAGDPVGELLAIARGHAVFCRRDVAGVVMALRFEFAGQDHPVARAIAATTDGGVKRISRLISAGRRQGTIPPGPPAKAAALAYLGALEGATIMLAGQAPNDEELAARAVAGVLGLESAKRPAPSAGGRR